MRKLTREWVRKAEGDYRLSVKLGAEPEVFPDQLCFHCQQAAEKYLKALLQELQLTVPHTHDLEKLLDLLIPHHLSLRPLRRGLKFLTNFAVGTRYPGETASKRQAVAALCWAGRTRDACRGLLGIGRSSRLPRKPSKKR